MRDSAKSETSVAGGRRARPCIFSSERNTGALAPFCRSMMLNAEPRSLPPPPEHPASAVRFFPPRQAGLCGLSATPKPGRAFYRYSKVDREHLAPTAAPPAGAGIFYPSPAARNKQFRSRFFGHTVT